MGERGKVLIILIAALAALAVVVSAAWASSEGSEVPRRVNTENVTKFTEATGVSEEGDHGATEDTREGKVEEGKPDNEGGAVTEGEAEEEAAGEEAGGEHHPWWMFPGWQSVFTALAVAYYALAVLLLPKIMAKEEHH